MFVKKIKTDSNVVIVGDIHGSADQLKRIIEKTKHLSPQYICVGDIIDRGPQSKEVIDLCIENNFIGCQGNHEVWFNFFGSTGQFDDYALSQIMGGKATLLSYGIDNFSIDNIERSKHKIPSSHFDFVRSLSPVILLEQGEHKYILSHGGIPANFIQAGEIEGSLEHFVRKNYNTILWTSACSNSPYPFSDHIQIFGHKPFSTVQNKIKNNSGWICLDTGAGTCYDKVLSAIVLPTQEIVSEK